MKPATVSLPLFIACLLFAAMSLPPAARPQTDAAAKSVTWKQVALAILKFNDEAPKSWNIYHTEKRGWILVRLWKRYLLISLQDEEVYDIDPQTLTPKGDALVWTEPEIPEQPIYISGWNQRDVGPFRRLRFRFGKEGHVLELQLPLRPDGRPMY
jgi:hypothetical protein